LPELRSLFKKCFVNSEAVMSFLCAVISSIDQFIKQGIGELASFTSMRVGHRSLWCKFPFSCHITLVFNNITFKFRQNIIKQWVDKSSTTRQSFKIVSCGYNETLNYRQLHRWFVVAKTGDKWFRHFITISTIFNDVNETIASSSYP
jgi:hypothetical protein